MVINSAKKGLFLLLFGAPGLEEAWLEIFPLGPCLTKATNYTASCQGALIIVQRSSRDTLMKCTDFETAEVRGENPKIFFLCSISSPEIC